VALVLPELAGKLNGLAIRVPTPNVSIVDIVVTVEKSGVSVSDVNAALQSRCRRGTQRHFGLLRPAPGIDGLQRQHPFIHRRCPTTYVVDQMVKVLSWYDNEAGYSHRMVDLAAMVGASL
jgi:glyceraldehyde 3-phosphate dehydrogenase